MSCVWHAGEPLVLPPSFYRQAFQLQQQYNTHGIKITNSFQTNAMLINQEWCDFFLEHRVRIGVSIDGPAFLHNANRVDRKGRGTFDQVMQGIELLRANDIRYSVIAVVTGETVHHPDAFWQFFMDLQPTYLGLNPEEVEGCNEYSSLYTPEGMIQYKHFLQRLLVLHTMYQSSLPIREFHVLQQRIQSGQMVLQTDTNTPGTILSFDHEGNISTFSPELLSFRHHHYGGFSYGNVFDTNLDDITQHKKFIAVNTAIQSGVAKCQESCEYFLLCGGGAPSNKLHENGSFDSAETNACRLHVKATTDVLLAYLEEKYYLSPPSFDNSDNEFF
jgi:uncharacterized protein